MRDVVIVDDDHTYLSLLNRAIQLEKLADRVFLVSSAEEFRQRLTDPTQAVGLAVLDVNLQGEEGGFELLVWLDELPHCPRARLQSWTVDPADQERALALGSELNLKVNSFTALRAQLREWVALAQT